MAIQHFQEKVAVVTGAASGIGFALCEALVARGCHVAMLDQDEAVIALAEGRSAHKTRVTGHACDVSNPGQMTRVAEEVVRVHGAVHLLVNNAGVSLAGGFEESSQEDFDWLMRVNFFGVVYGCRAYLPI